MGQYKRVKMVLEDTEIKREDLVSIVEAAKFLGITVQGLSTAMDRNQLPVYVDSKAPNPRRSRRLLLWSEVRARKQKRDGGEKCQQQVI